MTEMSDTSFKEWYKSWVDSIVILDSVPDTSKHLTYKLRDTPRDVVIEFWMDEVKLLEHRARSRRLAHKFGKRLQGRWVLTSYHGNEGATIQKVDDRINFEIKFDFVQ